MLENGFTEEELAAIRSGIEQECEEAVEYAQNAETLSLDEAKELIFCMNGRNTMEMTFLQSVSDALREEMRRDEKVFLLGEDMGVYGGCFGVTRGFLDEFGEERVMDTPISEGGFTSVAVGAAMAGYRPVVGIYVF